MGHNIMETHLKIGKIPDPSNHPEAALKALIAHYECMEHASRFIDLSSDEGAEAEIMTGTYLKKILSFSRFVLDRMMMSSIKLKPMLQKGGHNTKR